MFYVVDTRDQEPHLSQRAQGPYDLEEAERWANWLNDYIMRNAGLSPKFTVLPVTKITTTVNGEERSNLVFASLAR